jgi:large subunit ribosomal protein L4
VGNWRAPPRRGGGVAHGPVVRSYETALNKRVRRAGLKVALSAKLAEGRLLLVRSTHDGVEPKTKWLDGRLDALLGNQSLAAGGRSHSVLMAEVTPTEAEGALEARRKDLRTGRPARTWISNAKRASRNLPHVHVMHQKGLNVYDILRYRSLALTPDALRALVRRLDAPLKPGRMTKDDRLVDEDADPLLPPPEAPARMDAPAA